RVRRPAHGLWIELDRALEFAPGAVPVPLVQQLLDAERDVRLGEVVVEIDRFLRRLAALLPGLACRERSVDAERAVGDGQAGVGQRVRRVLVEGLTVVGDAGVNFIHQRRPCEYS